MIYSCGLLLTFFNKSTHGAFVEIRVGLLPCSNRSGHPMTACILSNRTEIFVGVTLYAPRFDVWRRHLFTATLATAKSTSPRPERNIAELIIRKEDSSVAHVHE